MSRYSALATHSVWGDVTVNYGTDNALGYWYDVFRVHPKIELGKFIEHIDIETEQGYIFVDGVVRLVKTVSDGKWYEIGEWGLFEITECWDFCYEPEKEAVLFPAGNHLWIRQEDMYTDNPVIDKCTTFNGLTHNQWITELNQLGVVFLM